MGSGLGIIGKDNFKSVNELGAVSQEEIPKETEEKLDQIVKKYPHKKSAIMPALFVAQDHYGWISREAIAWVSKKLSIAPAHVESVATFYTMYYKRPVGKYHIQVCRTLSCMLCGAKDLSVYISNRLSVPPVEPTPDGIWSWEEVECLGSCGSAPMVQINDVFFEFLTPESLGVLMDEIEKELPDLRFHTKDFALGSGLPDHPRSQVLSQNE